MKKNSILGFALIAGILIIFSWYNSKIYNEQQKNLPVADSIVSAKSPDTLVNGVNDSIVNSNITANSKDSLKKNDSSFSIYKDSLLIKASNQPEEFTTLENEKVKIDFTNLGAQAYKVQVKNYFTFDSLDLNLIREKTSKFSLVFFTNQQISTSNFAFEKAESTDSSLTYRLFLDSTSFVEYKYILPANSNLLKFNVRMVGMGKHIPRNITTLDLNWSLDLPRLEKGYDNEKNYSTIVYKFPNSNGVEDLGLRKDDSEKDVRTKVSWFAFQQQFFSAILVAKDNFNVGILNYRFYPLGDPDGNLMHCEAKMQVSYNDAEEVNIPFEYYYGPNHYKTLKSYDKGFEKIVPLGGWLIGWINRYIIILMFDFLGKFMTNYGLIILILTLLIKIVISPLTLKSYMSSAKMRVLKPEIDKIAEKYPKQEDAMKKQQETMALYSKAGVSMFGGCLPMLLQFPILFAMFKFFPASFELRQQGFLWATDLSAFDSVLDLPFTIPLYGDHVSLFALLMAISMYFYSRMNIDQMTTGGPQMAGMKYMSLYFMPIFLLVLCNNFSSGLSYYYMLSNLITMAQTWVIRKYFVDEEKLYAKLKEKAASNTPKKKSKFQERLDAAYKAQQQQVKKKK
ncbi:MAG: membrane protein insertase YidC [Bacteroidales bacterium]|jgi:YidC/Oxa1 family membrane protein insertase